MAKTIQCELCPTECVLENYQIGGCRVRINREGKLYSLVYGKPCSVAIDPIEKKPFFHVMPGTKAFSIATVGCKFCQNWQISQAKPEEADNVNLPPADAVRKAMFYGCSTVTHTYEELLRMAKETITTYVREKRIPTFDVKNGRLKANGATFVTINRNGQLRGCIGNITSAMPLFQSVINNAISACSKDRRFRPMTEAEINDIDVEITILSPLEPLGDVEDIEIGRHGLYITKGRNSGLLLPQVAKEYGWSRERFLEQVSRKAGLPKDAWKSANLYRFTAEIVK